MAAGKWKGVVTALRTTGLLAHEAANAGQPCFACDSCPGFELHFWRKMCMHCKCSQASHGQVEVDRAPRVKVGKISEQIKETFTTKTHERHMVSFRSRVAHNKDKLSKGEVFEAPVVIDDQDNQLAWKPEGLSTEQAGAFFEAPFPQEFVPIAGSAGEKQMHLEIEKQFPRWDFDQELCDNLTPEEAAEFVAFQEVKGQAYCEGQVAVTQVTGSCTACHQPILEGKLEVTVPLLPGARWHPYCFCCTTCKSFLAGLHCFINGNEIYCARHWADLFKARCAACDESIYEEAFAQAENQNWHLKHWRCFVCDCSLAGVGYVPVKDMPHCEPCFKRELAPTCSGCGCVMDIDAPKISKNGEYWHHRCYGKPSTAPTPAGGTSARGQNALPLPPRRGSSDPGSAATPLPPLPPRRASREVDAAPPLPPRGRKP